MANSLLLAGLVLPLAPFLPVGLWQDAPTDLTPLASAVDAAAELAVREGFVPGGAVALIEGGEVTLMRGYGFADGDGGEPVTPETIFQIGSISKTVAAWGVMRLVETGKVKLEAPIASVVTRWELPESEFDASGVTIQRLLSHTAGLSVHGYPGHGPNAELPTIEQSLSGEPSQATAVQLVSAPGTEWSYSGGGYTLLQLAVEELSGESFEAYLEREVLDPLGMTSSRFGSPRFPERFARAHSAYGETVPSPRFTALAAAGIHTTLEDMVKFTFASMASEDGPLSVETVQLMQKPVPVGDGAYGLGYQYGSVGEHQWVGHGGSNIVWLANMRLVPETGDGILVFTNSSRGGRMIGDVTRVWSEAMGAEPRASGSSKRSAAAELEPLVRSQGVAAAKAHYAKLREEHRREYQFSMSELVALGLRTIRTGEPDKGIELLRWVVELKPKSYRYPRVLGDAFERLGRHEEALAAWRKAADLGSKEAAARLAEKK